MDTSIITDLEDERNALRAEVERLESSAASLADTVASALRNVGVSDDGIELGVDLRPFVWKLSDVAIRNKYDLAAAVEVLREAFQEDYVLQDKWDELVIRARALLARLEVRP